MQHIIDERQKRVQQRQEDEEGSAGAVHALRNRTSHFAMQPRSSRSRLNQRRAPSTPGHTITATTTLLHM